ncbi:MAG: hypothetical protein Q4C01_04670 [Clostridia bacterium]|nr:hypothetical protein [Clostridia bacterium]
MALKKCPICELNYLRGNETVCHVCQKAKKNRDEEEEFITICFECGENPVVAGHELCAECMLEAKRQAELELTADKVRQDELAVPLEDDLENPIKDDENVDLIKELLDAPVEDGSKVGI